MPSQVRGQLLEEIHGYWLGSFLFLRMRSGVETATGAVMPILTSVVSVSPSTALQLLLAQQQLEGQQQLQGGQQQHQPPRARGGAGMPSGILKDRH